MYVSPMGIFPQPQSWLYFREFTSILEGVRLTSLRERFDNVIAELTIIKDVLDKCSKSPPCCLILRKDGEIGCNMVEPTKKSQFYEKCEECRKHIRKFLDEIRLEN